MYRVTIFMFLLHTLVKCLKITRTVSQITRITSCGTTRYLPLLLISLEIVWIRIILLCAHPQIVYYNYVKVTISISSSLKVDFLLTRNMERQTDRTDKTRQTDRTDRTGRTDRTNRQTDRQGDSYFPTKTLFAGI